MEKPRFQARKTVRLAAGALMVFSPATETNAERPARTPTHESQQWTERTPVRIDLTHTTLSEQELMRRKKESISSLLASVPPGEKFSNLKDPDILDAESQAYIPNEQERATVVSSAGEHFKVLAAAIPPNRFGLFAHADIDTQSREQQRLYILQKDGDGTVRFVQAFRVSMASRGFGNEKDSKKTPLGLHYVRSGYEGMLGEVVSAETTNLQFFKKTYIDARGKKHHFVSDFSHIEIAEPSAVVTDRYTIDEQRGIHFHGTNRSGRFVVRNGKREWHSFLSERTSSACIRMSNTDVRMMGRNYISLPSNGDRGAERGTPVYIFATPAVLAKHRTP